MKFLLFLIFKILWLTGLCVIICINLYIYNVDAWYLSQNTLKTEFIECHTYQQGIQTNDISLLKQCYFFICRSISFKETDVGKVSGYPKKDLKNLKHKFYLKFPTGSTASNSSVTQFVVVNSALYGITGSVVAVVSFWV